MRPATTHITQPDGGSAWERFRGKVRRRLSTRAIVEMVVMVVLAYWIARSGPVLRFYARHVPALGAREAVQPATEFAARVVAGARGQIGVVYDSDYCPIPYPGGDVASDRGACSDVVVRALRHAGIDLQRLIHEDKLAAPAEYPQLGTNPEPDTNIDHRRCANQMRFLARHGQTLTKEVSPATREQWQPGDVVYWRQRGDRLHVGVLSDRANGASLPLVIHNGSVCMEQDCLTNWEIVGHFRYSP